MKNKQEFNSLRELRLERGYTQKEMADLLGYTGYSRQAAYSSLEIGVNQTTLERIVLLAEILEVDTGTVIDLLIKARKEREELELK